MKDQLFKLLSRVSSDYAFCYYYFCFALVSPTDSTDDGSTGLPSVSVTVSVVTVLSAAMVLIIIVCVVLVVMYRRKSKKFDIRCER